MYYTVRNDDNWTLFVLPFIIYTVALQEKGMALSLKDMTGLELVQAMVDGVVPHPSMADTIPMRCVLAEEGRIVFEVKADKRHINPYGGVHGGFSATVLDSVMGSAVQTMLEANVGYATIDLNVKMLRPVPQDVLLIAEGRLINISKSLGTADGSLKDDSGKIYAHATTTCMIIRK